MTANGMQRVWLKAALSILFIIVMVAPFAAQATDLMRVASGSHQWRTLLGYQSGQLHSDIITEAFFLSPEGQHNPLAELIFTREAMMAPAQGDPDAHAQCRFPARYIFLKSRHLLPESTIEQPCPAYRAWLGEKPLTGASIIFASGHLSNPATYYGHMMLRLSTDEETGRAALLETAMNYGAVFPENENGLVYIVKGLSGGYESTWSNLPFYQHIYRYSEVQLRDVWEYRLNLSSDQTALLAAHAWEMRNVFNRYYFLKQNCAYRIAELVGVVLDGPIIPEIKPWVMPVDVLESVSLARNGDAPLLKDVVRLDSRHTRLRTKYSALSHDERKALSDYLRDPAKGVEFYLTALSHKQQSRVLETLIDYFTVSTDEERLVPEEEAMRHQALMARVRRPAGGSDFGNAIIPQLPHEGQKSTMVQVWATSNSHSDNRGQIRFRAAYNDFLSLTPGALAYSELSFLDLKVDLTPNRLKLNSLDAIRLTTLNVNQSGVPGEDGMAWRVRVGVERKNPGCEDCLVGVAEAHAGKAKMVAPGWVIYGLTGVRAYGPHTQSEPLQLGISGGVIYNAGGRFRIYGEGNIWDDFSGRGGSQSTFMIEGRYKLSRDWDLAGGWLWHGNAEVRSSEVRAGLSYYW